MKNLVIGAMLALILYGCDNVKAPPAAQLDPLPRSNYPAVTLEQGIDRHLVADYDNIVLREPTAESPLRVAVPIRTKADVQMRIQYEFRWFDENGMEIGRSGQRFEVVEPRRQVQLQANATTSKATRWRLEVRAAR